MRDPLRRLQYLPWRSLLQVSALTTLIVVALELLLAFEYARSLEFRRTIFVVYAPPFGIIISVAIALGVGAMAVYILERWYKQVFINSSSLWALVPCLALLLLLKSLLPIDPLLVKLDSTRLMGIIVGIFLKGRRYWR